MKITNARISILIIIMSVCVSGCGGNGRLSSDPLQLMIENKVAEYKSAYPGMSGGAALRISTPRGSYFVSAGIGDNVTGNTHFRIASCTKTFTAAAIMLLYQNNLLDIDDRITDTIPGKGEPYAPDTPEYNIPYKNDITIRLLLEHRAGVFDVSNSPVPEDAAAPYAGQIYTDYAKELPGQDEHTFTFDELVGVVAGNSLSYFAPGAEYHYSNTGYSILGKIIERVSGMRYHEYVAVNLLAPNGLDDIRFPSEGDDKSLPEPYATGYTYVGGESFETTFDNMSPHVSEGNAITTSRDLSRWVRLLIRGESGLDPEHVAMMMDVQPSGDGHGNYGLGITYTEGLGYGHNGAHVGYMTVMRHDPATDVSVVAFSSSINADNLIANIDFLYDVARSGRRILGY